MRIAKIVLLFASVLIVTACSKNRKEKIDRLINSEGSCDRVKGYLLIKKRDTEFVKRSLTIDSFDRTIAHCFWHYGKSVVWAKMKAISKISGITPPVSDIRPDTSVLSIYREWAIKSGFIEY